MKLPQPPPPLEPILQKLQRDAPRLVTVISSSGGLQNKSYLPWDKVRYHKPPGDLSSEEWWLAISLGRNAMRRPLPLYDKSGNKFSYAMPDEILRLRRK